ncbi:heme peroxidase [Cyathus striatus]|nr:heme peroxidase [Cyathus striatus]
MSSLLRPSLRRVAAASRAAPKPKANFNNAFRRRYATSPEGSTGSTSGGKSNTPLLLGVGAVALAGLGGYFVLTSKDSAGTQVRSAVASAKAKTGYVPSKEDYIKVYNRITELMDDSDYDDGSYGPVLLRLAWHSSGTYDKESNTGGSNYATMRFEPEALHGANAGLRVAREFLEKVKQEFPWISYGDLWTLAGVAAVQEMGGPHIAWRPGRIDGQQKDATPDGRLPDASQGADHLRNIFYRMGFNDQEIVALSGAHALGRCHRDRSGFDGPWTFSPTTLTNDFYRLLFDEKWVWRKWDGPKQLEDKRTKSLMMLPTDYVLVQDKSFKRYAKEYADDQDKFFRDFSKVVATLFELGVPRTQFVTEEAWILPTVDEQEEAKEKEKEKK